MPCLRSRSILPKSRARLKSIRVAAASLFVQVEEFSSFILPTIHTFGRAEARLDSCPSMEGAKIGYKSTSWLFCPHVSYVDMGCMLFFEATWEEKRKKQTRLIGVPLTYPACSFLVRRCLPIESPNLRPDPPCKTPGHWGLPQPGTPQLSPFKYTVYYCSLE